MNQPLLRRPEFKLSLTLAALLAATCCRADDSWGAWPSGQEPVTIGSRVVQNILDRKPDAAHGCTYQETCSGYGAVRFASAINDQDLLNKVIARYQAIITPEGASLLPKPGHDDRTVFGILPLEMYKVTQDQKYLDLGLSYADAQFAKLNPEGLSSETRGYIDESFKIPVMQILAYAASQKAVYAANSVKQLTSFIDKFQQPNGLFFHGADAHVYWGRGNGWFAAALAEVLLHLPPDDPARPKIMASYQAMMAGLLKVQSPDGRWRQVLDDDKAWPENSCTAYFIYAMGEGVDQGWLDAATYRPAVKKAWGALCGQLDDKANVADVAVVTEHSNDEAYYLAVKRVTGNIHGEFATLWAATALVEKKP